MTVAGVPATMPVRLIATEVDERYVAVRVAFVTTGVNPLWKPVPDTFTFMVWPATITVAGRARSPSER